MALNEPPGSFPVGTATVASIANEIRAAILPEITQMVKEQLKSASLKDSQNESSGSTHDDRNDNESQSSSINLAGYTDEGNDTFLTLPCSLNDGMRPFPSTWIDWSF